MDVDTVPYVAPKAPLRDPPTTNRPTPPESTSQVVNDASKKDQPAPRREFLDYVKIPVTNNKYIKRSLKPMVVPEIDEAILENNVSKEVTIPKKDRRTEEAPRRRKEKEKKEKKSAKKKKREKSEKKKSEKKDKKSKSESAKSVKRLQKKLEDAVQKSSNEKEEIERLTGLLPRPIRLTWKDKPFNILEFTRAVEVTGLSLSQLLALSPALRKILSDSLKTLPAKEHNVLLAKYPRIGLDAENPEVYAYLARTDMAKNTTHHFIATVNGHPLKPFLDGGACVNVCSPQFLKRANITGVTNVANMSVQSIGGVLPTIGEASQIPLEIAGQTVIIGCIVIDNAPFEL
ncbi:hypothetical protein BGZ76_006546, partial [Entomortierella beljakovae]